MNESVLTVQACTFLAVSGLTYLVFRGIWSFDKRVRQRLEGLRHGHVLSLPPLASAKTASTGGKARSRILRIAARLLPDDQRERTQLEVRLMHAGIYAPWALSFFLSVKMCMIIAPPLVGFLLGQFGYFDPRTSLLYGGIAGGFGIVLPRFWLDRRKGAKTGPALALAARPARPDGRVCAERHEYRSRSAAHDG